MFKISKKIETFLRLFLAYCKNIYFKGINIPFFSYIVYNKPKECLVKEKIIEIREGEEYITLNVVLKISDLISTGGQAKIYLLENEVLVNKESESRRGRKLYPGDVVETNGTRILIQ